MTQKLYYNQPTLTEWTTKIKEVTKKESLFHIKLEDSAFYPESGGQPSDFGTIDGISVIEIYEKGEDTIHVLQERPRDETVTCQINWKRRFDHMQHHSGQHLLSATIIELYDIPTVSFHLGKDTVTIDLDTPTLSNDQIMNIEHAANQKIFENIEIKTYFVEKDDLHNIPLRKLPKVAENIRIVEISTFDFSACCGTHVTRTGEIGILKLLKTEKVRQTTRLHFKCGIRALEEFQKLNSVLTSINGKLNTSTELVTSKVEQVIFELKSAQKEIDHFKTEHFEVISDHLIKGSKNNLITHSFKNESAKDIQIVVKMIQTKHPSLILFISEKENKIMLFNQLENGIHCGDLIKILLQKVAGKGGGNAKQAQATFEDSDYLNKAIHNLTLQLTNEVEAK